MANMKSMFLRAAPWMMVTNRRTPPEKNLDEFLKAYTYWAYACSRAIADNVAEVPLQLFAVSSNGDEKEIHDHPALTLLQQANPWMTEYELREMLSLHLELTGEGYWAIERNRLGLPGELWPLMPPYVTLLQSPTAFIDAVEYRVPGNGVLTYAAEDVIQFKYSNPSSLYRGWSPTRAAALPLDIHQYAQEWMREFFFNDATPGGVLSSDQPLTRTQAEEIQMRWSENHHGRGKHHRIAIMGMGTKFQTIDRSLQELTFTDEQRRLRDDILGIYGVPKAVLGITDDVNRANAEAAEYTFAKRVIRPRLRRIEQRLNEFLIARFFDPRLKLRFADPVPENRELNLKEADTAVRGGWMKVNEGLKKIGEEERPEGDVYLVPTSVVPTKPEDYGVLPEPIPATTAPAAGATPAGAGTGKSAHPTPHPRHENPLDDAMAAERAMTDASRWGAWVRMTERLEQPIIRVLKRFFQGQQNFVNRRLREVLGGKSIRGIVTVTAPDGTKRTFVRVNKDLIDVEIFLWDSDESEQDLAKRLTPPMTHVAVTAGDRAIADLGLSISFDVQHPGVVTRLREQVTKVVGLVDETTRDQVRATLTDGLDAGEGIPQLSDRITGVFDAAKGRRAQTIARTETNGAASLGTEQAWIQTGVVTGKRWISAGDERTRQPPDSKYDHIKPGAVPEIVPVEAMFTMTGERLRYPGDYNGAAGNIINCRCTMAPVTITDEEV